MRNKNEQTLKEVIDQLLKVYKIGGKLNEVNLISSWEKQMGPMIARHTKDIFISNKVLFVTLDSAALRSELSYAKGKIVSMLNTEAGTEVITDVIFK